jgi:hypothetical protein
MRRSIATYVYAVLGTAAILFWSGCGRLSGWPHACTADCQHEQHANEDCEQCDQHAHEAGCEDCEQEDCAKLCTSIGPTGGRMIVLGEHELHAELTIDHAQCSATVLILDRSARRPLAIDQDHVLLNLVVDRRPRQIKLLAAPQQDEPARSTSRFIGHDPVLREEFKPSGRLSLVVGGKPYTGQVAARATDRQLIR